jgi:thioredoxin reductase (NADPH)
MDNITALEKTAEGFKVIGENTTYEAKSVILALGAKHRMLGLEREHELVGNGISFCAVCDGAFYAGQDVAMVGGGNSALQEALLLAETSKSVTVIQNLPHFTGEQKLAQALMEKDNVTVHFSTLVTGYLQENGSLTGLNLRSEDGREFSVDVDGAFLAVGLSPENDAFAAHAELNQWGYFDSAEDCRTRTEGLFVAGDCRSKRIRQVVTAASDGAVAAMAACMYLDQN